jgi:predicted nucleotidyltransferase
MPTADAKETSSLASYVYGWRRRSRLEAEKVTAWRERVRARIDPVVKMLVRDFRVSRVVLFGSFARGEAVPGSDVDLLVTGISAERVLDAVVAADRILRESALDLVPSELARPVVRERAEREGVVLYGR